MKRFMYLSIGVLCLAMAALISFHIGSQRAEAQTEIGAQYYVEAGGGFNVFAILPNGDVYVNNTNTTAGFERHPSTYVGNFWEGTVSTDKATWGKVKGQYDR